MIAGNINFIPRELSKVHYCAEPAASNSNLTQNSCSQCNSNTCDRYGASPALNVLSLAPFMADFHLKEN